MRFGIFNFFPVARLYPKPYLQPRFTQTVPSSGVVCILVPV